MMQALTSEMVAALGGVRVDTLNRSQVLGGKPLARGSGPDRRRRYYRPEDVTAWLEARALLRARHAHRNVAILASIAAGERYQDIADRHGLTLGHVSGIAIESGVQNRPRRLDSFRHEALAFAREHTFDKAAAQFGVSRRSLFVWARALEA